MPPALPQGWGSCSCGPTGPHCVQLGSRQPGQGLLSPHLLFTVVSALNKAWCVNCFSCSACNGKLTLK